MHYRCICSMLVSIICKTDTSILTTILNFVESKLDIVMTKHDLVSYIILP